MSRREDGSPGPFGHIIFEQPVADRDRSAGQDVRPQPAAVHEILDDPGAGEPLQVQARLAELDSETLDLADAEALADQVVDPDAADHDLPTGLRPGEADVSEHLGLDEGKRLSGRGPAGEEVAVALQAVACDRADGFDRGQRITGSDVDGFDMHAIYHPARPAGPPSGLPGRAAAGVAAGPAAGERTRHLCALTVT